MTDKERYEKMWEDTTISELRQMFDSRKEKHRMMKKIHSLENRLCRMKQEIEELKTQTGI